MEPLLINIFSGGVALWLGFMEWRYRRVIEIMDKKPDKEDIKEYIGLKQETLITVTESLKEDIDRLESKIDFLTKLNLKD